MKLLLTIICLLPLTALAGGDDVYVQAPVGNATETTQIANNVLLKENSMYQSSILDHQVKMLITQSEMLAKQLEQINNMNKNTKSITDPVWSNTAQLLQNLGKIVKSGQALSYSSQNMNEEFTNKYPGYRTSNNYSKDYQEWSNITMDSIRGSMNAANLQANEFVTEDKLISQLQTMSKTSEGRMQAIQVGNMIATENVQQLRKLRQLQMAQMQAQNNYLVSRNQKEMTKQAALDNFLNVDDPTLNRKYKTFKGGNVK